VFNVQSASMNIKKTTKTNNIIILTPETFSMALERNSEAVACLSLDVCRSSSSDLVSNKLHNGDSEMCSAMCWDIQPVNNNNSK